MKVLASAQQFEIEFYQMIFTETSIAGAWLVDLKHMEDHRGYFARAWSAKEFSELGLPSHFPDINFSLSKQRGTIRGLHYQRAPHQEAKFVRCTSGILYDVIIDLRPDSATYLNWASFEIDSKSGRAVYIPAGCAHGMQALEDNTGMLYMVSTSYHPESEGGIRWDDPLFSIAWPETENIIISEKDYMWPDFMPDTLRT